MNIPFLDLHRQYKDIKKEIDEAVKRVVDRQYFILGEELKAFEEEFAKYLGVKYVVGLGSGTDGLIFSLWTLNLKPDDEIITPANSFIATTLAITQNKAKPVLVDMDPITYEIDIEQVRRKINKKTKAILPVHLYGAPCQIDEIVKIAKQHDLWIIEDAAQAHGAMLRNKKMGAYGDLAVFSFYPGKNMGAYGDGGAISTNDVKLYNKLRKLRNYGQTKKYYHQTIGINSRLDEIQAAILRVKLKHLDEWNKKRNKIAECYDENLQRVKKQVIIKNGYSNYHLYVIEHPNRDQLQRYLAVNGVQTLIHYPLPIHLQECYKDLKYKKGSFPASEFSADRLLSLPIYPELKEKEIKYIINLINTFKV